MGIVTLLSEVQRTCKWCHVAMQSQLRTTIIQDDQFLMVGNVTFNTAFLSQSHVTCNACLLIVYYGLPQIISYYCHRTGWAAVQCLEKKVCKWQYFVVVSKQVDLKALEQKQFFLTSDWLFTGRTLEPCHEHLMYVYTFFSAHTCRMRALHFVKSI